MRMFSATGNTAYGFDFSFNDDTYGQGPHLAITNEHQTWNQAIILGDTLIGDPGVLFGVSAATIANSLATTGQEAGWTPAFYVTGQSTYLPLVASGNTGNILYIDPSDDGKVSYGPAPSIAIQEEGTNVVANANTINFVGSGVTASNVGGVATVTISGGISGVSVQEEGTNVVASANTINFVGNGVVASNVGNVATITINSGGTPAEVVDGKTGTHDIIFVVNLSTLQVTTAHAIYQHFYARDFKIPVVFVLDVIQGKSILHTATPTTLHKHT